MDRLSGACSVCGTNALERVRPYADNHPLTDFMSVTTDLIPIPSLGELNEVHSSKRPEPELSATTRCHRFEPFDHGSHDRLMGRDLMAGLVIGDLYVTLTAERLGYAADCEPLMIMVHQKRRTPMDQPL